MRKATENDALMNIRRMLVGIDQKSLGMILHELRRLCARNKRVRQMAIGILRRRTAFLLHRHCSTWHHIVLEVKMFASKTSKVTCRVNR